MMHSLSQILITKDLALTSMGSTVLEFEMQPSKTCDASAVAGET